MAKFFEGMKLVFYHDYGVGPPCNSARMVFGCLLTVFTLNGWRLLSLTLLRGVGNIFQSRNKNMLRADAFVIRSAFCSNTSSLLGAGLEHCLVHSNHALHQPQIYEFYHFFTEQLSPWCP